MLVYILYVIQNTKFKFLNLIINVHKKIQMTNWLDYLISDAMEAKLTILFDLANHLIDSLKMILFVTKEHICLN